MRTFILSLVLVLISTHLMAQKEAYTLFDAKGKKISYNKSLKKATEADVICFGELHNNPIAHWLQYEMLADLIEKRGEESLVVGAEMFETDQQDLIFQYLKGEITDKELKEATKLWPNYETDYRPIVELCKEKGIDVIATNIPRKYARKVATEGGIKALDSLNNSEQALMVPLPFTIDFDLPSYVAMKEMMGGHGGELKIKSFIMAQAIKDATMAHFLLMHLAENQLFYHLNGSYHSDSKEGIMWYVRQANPELKLFNISVKEQDDLNKLEEEYLGVADIIIVVPTTMTKTY